MDLPGVTRRPDTDDFLATVRAEQARFLATIRRACSELPRESGQLACVAATQARLAQQFFDAQRAILTHRADVDAAVERIGGSSTSDSTAVATGTTVPVSRNFAHRSPRQELAELGLAVVRTKADTDSLADMIDDAFEPDEPSGIVQQRQLAALLDTWWSTAKADGAEAVDDARAHAAMREHIAAIDAGTRVAVPPAECHRPSTQLLPTAVLSALDSPDAATLRALLDTLAASLQPGPQAGGASPSLVSANSR